MLLQLKPHTKNDFPISGLLIEGNQVIYWLEEIQRMQLPLRKVEVYPIPNTTANSVWGCLVVGKLSNLNIDIGKNSFCQLVKKTIFIPEKSTIYPKIGENELLELFGGRLHLMHPIIGLVELGNLLDWASLIQIPQQEKLFISKPKEGSHIPTSIKSFQIHAVSPEDVLENLEKSTFPNREKLDNQPLTMAEKARLAFYKQLFEKTGGTTESNDDQTRMTPLMGMLAAARGLFSDDAPEWTDEMRQDFEDLERRNQSQLDRLMEMLKENPEEALKYAIPLDDKGTSRGGTSDMGKEGAFDLFKRWSDFSLFGSDHSSSGGGSTTVSDDSYFRLNEQYRQTAQKLIEQGDYKKAAFVYMKLLKDYHKAAHTLEQGKLYQEAASIYLKYVKNKPKAAECYEKGRLFQDAIELYKELKQEEKVGDLYLKINQQKLAFHYYQTVVDRYVENNQYLKASLICKQKMQNVTTAQQLLLKGWIANSDAYNCLNNYFNNIDDAKLLGSEIQRIYTSDVDKSRQLIFLRAIKHEYATYPDLQEQIRNISYEIIVAQAVDNYSIVTELRFFNKDDQQLHKDVSRFKLKRYQR